MTVIKVYDQLHGLNEHIRALKKNVHEPKTSATYSNAEGLKTELGNNIRALISLLDAEFPKIAKNFRET